MTPALFFLLLNGMFSFAQRQDLQHPQCGALAPKYTNSGNDRATIAPGSVLAWQPPSKNNNTAGDCHKSIGIPTTITPQSRQEALPLGSCQAKAKAIVRVIVGERKIIKDQNFILQQSPEQSRRFRSAAAKRERFLARLWGDCCGN